MSKGRWFCLAVLVFCGCLWLGGCGTMVENLHLDFLDKVF